MKLNIEELAREADLSPMTADSHCRVDYWTATKIELEIFAHLIVEMCAQECDMADKSTHPSDLADAIRNLLED